MQKKQKHHEILERYCSHVDDNVIMTYKHGNHDKLICLSRDRCRHIHPNGCERAEKEDKTEPNTPPKKENRT